jgi:PAS domain S-box-containing protein
LTAGVAAVFLSASGFSFLMTANDRQSWLVWANVASDLVIIVSYLVILACLFWVARRLRRLPRVHGYLWIFCGFGLFILACASTRAMEVLTVWWAVYRVSVLLKMVCAFTSVATAVLFVCTAPEIKLAEDARERLAAVVDSSEDAIFSKDFGGIITAWNQGAEKVLGYAASDALGKSMRMLLPADRLDEESAILERIKRGERVEHFDTVRIRNDGRRIDVSVTLSPVRNGDGVIIGASTIARDISQRKQSEFIHAQQKERLASQAQELLQSQNDLEEQQSLLQSVLDSIGEGLIVADTNGKFLLWNPAAERLIGRSAALPISEWSAYYGNFLPDKVTPLPPDQVPLVRALRGETCSSEIFIRRRGGDETLWLECNASPLHDKTGAPQGGVVAFRDITQRKADEEKIANRTLQLEATNLELEAFSYTVSHDLRAPLRHIGSFAGILIEDFGAELNEEATGHLRRIQDAARRMGQLVDGLLNMAKLGRQSLRLRPTHLNAIVNDVIANLQGEWDGREVEWRIGALPALDCDPVLITQVFQNLLDNALKYSRTREPAIVEVGCTESPDHPAVIFVRDNGVGFDMKYAENLFGVFQRMHTESDFEGTGVGLAAAQRIVQKHGGDIWAEAQMDQGATFFFTLEGNDLQTRAIQALATA